ncbi:MAG: cytochrome c maturation protein CcmE [Pseudomonadota bacterium]
MAVGLKKKRRIQLVLVGFVCLAAGFTAIYFAAGDALQFFYSPSDIAEKRPGPDRVIRVGGLVEVGSVTWEGQTLDFVVTDGGATVPVVYSGLVPDLFAEGEGMVATGRLIDGVFQADEILAKHDETYMPKEVADALREQGVFRPPTD